MPALFLRRYSSALIGFFGAWSRQQHGKAVTTVAGSGALKYAILYLSGISSISPPPLSELLSVFEPCKSWCFQFGGSDTLCIVFFHRPLLHLISKYPTLTMIVPGSGSIWINLPLFSTVALTVLAVELISAISRPPTSSWKRRVKVPKSECAGLRMNSPDEDRPVGIAG